MGVFYQVTEIGAGIYRITSAEQVFMELFVGTQKALLLDTGYGYGNLREVVKRITSLPLYIVNSHGHVDHVSGNYQFEEDIYIHPKDMELCKMHTSMEMRQGAVETGRHTMNYQTGEVTNILPDDFDETSYLQGSTGNLIPVEEGHIFDLGGITLEVYELPGHTAGGIGLLYKEQKVLYVGDAINGFVWLFSPEALKLSDYIQTLHKAENMDFDRMVMAHVPVPLEKAGLADFMAAAREADYENGFPFMAPMAAGLSARICPRKGYGPDDFGKPGFASVVLSKDHLV